MWRVLALRKKALLKHFKSFRNLKAATLDELLGAKVVPDDVARELYHVLRQYNEATDEADAELGRQIGA